MNNQVDLQLEPGNPDELVFRMPEGAKMKEVKEAYARRIKLPVNALTFSFNGYPVRDDDTPETLKLKYDDIIEVKKKRFSPRLLKDGRVNP